MIARMIDAAFSAWTDRKMQRHLPYPAAQTALVLVDVQRTYLDRGAPGYRLISSVAEAVGFRENLERLVSGCRERGVAVVHAPFAISENPGATSPDIPYVQELRAREILLEDRERTQIPAELSADEDILLERRSTLNAFYGTALQRHLEERGVTHLLVAGSVANAGVDSTGRMGVELDYDVTYVSDCTAAFEMEDYDASVEVTFPRMAHRVCSADEVLERFDTHGG